MKDEIFIKVRLQHGREAKEKASSEFSNISGEKLNWQASPLSWSIAQCLDHLIVSHSVYFPALKKITDGNFKMNFWKSIARSPKFGGNIMKEQMQEQVKRKLKAPKKIQPVSKATLEIIERHDTSIEQFLTYISRCSAIDIDKTIITSPLLSMITYSKRCLTIQLHMNTGISTRRLG